jgi:hypothetical protein
MTSGEPPLGSTVSVAFIRVNGVDAGKSGWRSNAPVKSEMLKAFTPGELLAGRVKRSNERSPIGTVLAHMGMHSTNPNPNNTINRRFIGFLS